MGKLIDADKLKRKCQKTATEAWKMKIKASAEVIMNQFIDFIDEADTVDAVPVVRCKDCKHRPTGEEMEDLEFPDNRCPCRCEDYWYSWKPSDDWFCPYGERKDGDGNG